MRRGKPWVILLAGGGETRRTGESAGNGEDPLTLGEAIRAAAGLVSPDRIVVVGEIGEGAELWLPALDRAACVVPLPRRCGTGVYLLTALLAVLALDSRARLVVAQLDEAGRADDRLRRGFHEALPALAGRPDRLVLVGQQPRSADPNRGWIIPSYRPSGHPARTVATFIEKPDLKTARQLFAGGALVSAGVFAAVGRTLRDLYAAIVPQLVRELVCRQGETAAASLVVRLDGIPPCDLCREVLEWAHGSLAVVPVRARAARAPEDPRVLAGTRFPGVPQPAPAR